MSGSFQQDHEKFPELPDDLSIGGQTLQGRRSIVLKGIIGRETYTDIKIPPGKVNIIVHDKGIRLKNHDNKAVMEIHNAQIIGL